MFTIKNQIESYIFQQLIIKNYNKFKLFHQIYFTTTLSTSFLNTLAHLSMYERPIRGSLTLIWKGYFTSINGSRSWGCQTSTLSATQDCFLEIFMEPEI